MQYKSVRSSSKAWFKNSVSLTAVSLGSLLFTSASFAAMTVGPIKSSTDNTGLSNMDPNGSGTAYYPSNAAKTGADTLDPAVPNYVPTASQITNPDGTDALVFNLTATTASYTAPSGSTLTYHPYIMAFVTSANGNGNFPVPIVAYNSAPGAGGGYVKCNGNGCTLNGDAGAHPAGTSYYFAAPFNPNSTIQIGIYPSDLCYLYTSGGQLISNSADAGQVCDATGGPGSTPIYTPPAAGHVQGLQLKFAVVLIPDNGINQINPQSISSTDTNLSSAVDASHISITSDTALLNLSFQSQGGSITSCPDESATQIYYPGDQSIYLNTTLFQNNFTSPSLNGSTSGSGGIRVAPVQSILLTASTQTTAISPLPATPSYPAYTDGSNVIARNIAFGSDQQLVSGFTNTMPPDNPLYYNLGIYLRDAAGFVTSTTTVYPTAPFAACALNNVQAVEVQTFLKESKCFIATAAFRSMDAAPVAMLRQFRDQVLLHSSPGQAFVNWYYRWSPPAAEWLIDHPEFRYPVLLALVPVEIIAWLCLRPLIFVGLMGAGLLILVAMRKRISNSLRGESV